MNKQNIPEKATVETTARFIQQGRNCPTLTKCHAEKVKSILATPNKRAVIEYPKDLVQRG